MTPAGEAQESQPLGRPGDRIGRAGRHALRRVAGAQREHQNRAQKREKPLFHRESPFHLSD